MARVIILQKLECLLSLHGVILISNGWWNKKIVQRANTHLRNFVITVKPLVIVIFKVILNTFAMDDEMELSSY